MKYVRGLDGLYPVPEGALRTVEVPEQDREPGPGLVEVDPLHPDAAGGLAPAREVSGLAAGLDQYPAELFEHQALVLSL